MITIVGAGFSGLTLAYHLRRLGMAVRIFEREDRAGGLLNTQLGPYGLAESAANAILADSSLERLFEDLGVPFAERRPERKKRFIYWQKTVSLATHSFHYGKTCFGSWTTSLG